MRRARVTSSIVLSKRRLVCVVRVGRKDENVNVKESMSDHLQQTKKSRANESVEMETNEGQSMQGPIKCARIHLQKGEDGCCSRTVAEIICFELVENRQESQGRNRKFGMKFKRFVMSGKVERIEGKQGTKERRRRTTSVIFNVT